MKQQHNKLRSVNELGVAPGLEKLVQALKPGMELEGRIVDVLEDGVFILRIRGYNILAESNYPFQRFDEAIMRVQAVNPMVFSVHPRSMKNGSNALYA